VIAVDSSVAIAAFGDWHQMNTAACAVLDDGATIPAHALLETYAVLTGFPPPYRAQPDLVRTWLDDRFPSALPAPGPAEHQELVRLIAGSGRPGAAICDALIGQTVKAAGAELVTADRRAMPVYELVGVVVRPLDS
jgi:predicted nucleic acid-binding protein